MLQLNGITYTDKQTGERRLGWTAQNMQKVEPTLTNSVQNGMLGVNYQNSVALLQEAIKEQQSQIEELKVLLQQALAFR